MTTLPAASEAPWCRLRVAGFLVWPRAEFLTRWHIHRGRLCHLQQFFARINCPRSESPNGRDTFSDWKLWGLLQAKGWLRSPLDADLKKKSAGKQPWRVCGLFFLTCERSAYPLEMSSELIRGLLSTGKQLALLPGHPRKQPQLWSWEIDIIVDDREPWWNAFSN